MKKRTLYALCILIVGVIIIYFYATSNKSRLQHLSGQTMGTIIYNVKYIGHEDQLMKAKIDSLLTDFNQSLSTYISNSEISVLNRTGSLQYSSGFFYPVLEKSKVIYDNTNGTFDPTIGPLVQAWGFGPDKNIPDLDSAFVDSLRLLVGLNRVEFTKEYIRMPANFQLDFSAIAKGYAVDLVGELLEQHEIMNYMIEIGGEVRCSGVNQENKSWSLGIEDPLVGREEQKLLAIVRLKDRSLATSGNYRNYYEKEGRTYAHIIDPRSGYSSNQHLLSASVFADDCMTADAYATAFMVLGLEESKKIVDAQNIDAILIYQDENGKLMSFVSEGIIPYVELNKTN